MQRLLAWFSSRRLLEIFVGVSLAMLGIALVFGPSPVPRVYLAATPATTHVLGPTISSAGFQYLTPANAGDQFDTMSTLGNYNLVILADYPPNIDSSGLAANYHIFAMTYYAPSQYVTTLKAGLREQRQAAQQHAGAELRPEQREVLRAGEQPRTPCHPFGVQGRGPRGGPPHLPAGLRCDGVPGKNSRRDGERRESAQSPRAPSTVSPSS